MFETKKDHNETEMRTVIELLYSSIAMKEQALSRKIFLWGYSLLKMKDSSWGGDLLLLM